MEITLLDSILHTPCSTDEKDQTKHERQQICCYTFDKLHCDLLLAGQQQEPTGI